MKLCQVLQASTLVLSAVHGVIQVEHESGSYGPFIAPRYSRLMGDRATSCSINSSAVVVSPEVDLCDLDQVSSLLNASEIAIFNDILGLACFEETVLNNFEKAGALALIFTSPVAPGYYLNKLNFGHKANEAGIQFLDVGADFHDLMFINRLEGDSEIHLTIEGCDVEEHIELCTNVVLTATNVILGIMYFLASYYAYISQKSLLKTVHTKPRRYILKFTAGLTFWAGIVFTLGLADRLLYFWPTGEVQVGFQLIGFAINGVLMHQAPLLSGAYWAFLESQIAFADKKKKLLGCYRHGDNFFKRSEIKFSILVGFIESILLMGLILQPQVDVQVTSLVLVLFDIFILLVLGISQNNFTKRILKIGNMRSEHDVVQASKNAVSIWLPCSKPMKINYRAFLASRNNTTAAPSNGGALELIFHLSYWLKIYVLATFAVAIGGTALVMNVGYSSNGASPTDFVITSCLFTSPLFVIYGSKCLTIVAIMQGLKGPKKVEPTNNKLLQTTSV